MALLKCNGSRASSLVTLLLIAALLFPAVCYAHVEAKTVCQETEYGCTQEKCHQMCLGDGRTVASQYCRHYDNQCCCTYELQANDNDKMDDGRLHA
ncbi:hypothetical protein DAI22_07g221200 [Oryza sativa Japonica Group]|nr:hypothetical protein DAI22_07g221200 [Oryza sativa Japonica Group]